MSFETKPKGKHHRYTCWSSKAPDRSHPAHTRRIILPTTRQLTVPEIVYRLGEAGWTPSADNPYVFVCPACKGLPAFDQDDFDTRDAVRLWSAMADYELGRPGVSPETASAAARALGLGRDQGIAPSLTPHQLSNVYGEVLTELWARQDVSRLSSFHQAQNNAVPRPGGDPS